MIIEKSAEKILWWLGVQPNQEKGGVANASFATVTKERVVLSMCNKDPKTPEHVTLPWDVFLEIYAAGLALKTPVENEEPAAEDEETSDEEENTEPATEDEDDKKKTEDEAHKEIMRLTKMYPQIKIIDEDCGYTMRYDVRIPAMNWECPFFAYSNTKLLEQIKCAIDFLEQEAS